MSDPLLIARTPDTELFLLPGMANRHGLITGATGTGKTVTLQKLAESLSEIGVPVFMADVKGDLTGIAQAGTASEKLLARLKNIDVNDWQPHANPVVVWDIFGEPMLDIKDWMRIDANGKGVINILSAEKLYQMPKLYAASLLWMISELYEQLPEAGDLEKPKLVFFFDEAHLLFNDAPQVLLDKIEQVIRLIRSKGVGVWFVSQNPSDIPDNVLGQLGNRVQHALRAFTPKDQKAVKAAAQTMRANPAFDTEKAIQELGTGEALISFLDAKGSPSVVERAMVIAPCSRMGPVTEDERNGLINHSPVYGKYEDDVDRESAYEMLQKGFQASTEQQNNPPAKGKEVAVDDGILGGLKDILFGTTGPRGGKKDGVVQTMAKSAARQVTNQIVRGMLGSLLGGRKR